MPRTFIPRLPVLAHFAVGAAASLASPGLLLAQTAPAEELATIEVVSSRYPAAGASAEVPLSQSAFGLTSVEREEMARQPQTSLDEVLKAAVPGFSLFRRTSSAVANPTTQGPSLRNIGPNGAGRSLVLLDGVPQNDPFGGWVYWHRLPPALLGRAQVVQGGGAGLFGNNALGGTVYLTRHVPQTLALETTVGDRDTLEGTLANSLNAGPFRISTTLHGQTTDGHPVVREDQRGPVDINADSRSWIAETAIATTLESGTEITLRGSWFEETRGNGTPYTGNHTEAFDLSLGIRGPAGEVQWESLVYYQHRQFESTFSSVNATRTAETPALDQYEVPAQSLGFSLTTTLADGIPLGPGSRDGSKLILGLDGRWIEGETRELFRYDAGRFLNQRVAGGTQWLTGAFAEQTWQLTPAWALTLGGRADYWRLQDGQRRERPLSGGSALVDAEYPDRDGVVANGRFGTAYRLTDSWTLRGAAYTGYRVPTLNELYRPFRVRNDITGANASLEPERLTGVEAGFTWEPVKTWQLSATVFWNELRDAVANVTVLSGPGVAPDGTVVPEGGVYRQRQNVEAVTTTGVELTTRWEPTKWLSLNAGYLYTDTEVQARTPALDGRELAQAPAHVLTSGLTLRPTDRWQALLQARYGSDQYEDDLNTLTLSSYIVWDASVTFQVTKTLSISVMGENLFDQEVETGKTGDGLVSVGAPRWFGVRMKWEF